jgi:hypothetical protein
LPGIDKKSLSYSLYKNMFGKILSKRSLVLLFVSVGVLVGVSTQAISMTREQKIWSSVSKLKDVKSWVYDGSISYYGKTGTKYSDLLSGMKAKKKSGQYQTFTLNFKGGRQVLTATENQSWFSLLTQSSDKKEAVIGLETRSVGGNFYAAINRVENFPFSLGEYKNLWVQFNFTSILNDLGFDSALLLEQKAVVQSADEKEQQQVKELAVKSKAFKVTGVYTAKLNGVVFDVYNFTINKNNLKKLTAGTASMSDGAVTAKQLADINKGMAKIKSISGNIWVSRKDGLPYRFSINIFGTQPRERTSINLNLNKFNEPVTVSEPASYITSQELLDKLFPKSSEFLINTSTTTTVPAIQ